ncbi:MAG: hypothetical protein PHR30_08200 [Gallionellaceae bacterium]|nr:hypothetical protein [Gallionellaceae bacterium]
MKTLLIAALLFHSGISMAGQDQVRETTVAASCNWLMTEAECSQHRKTLAELEPSARPAYIEHHLALLREREVMCSCGSERLVLARAQYR